MRSTFKIDFNKSRATECYTNKKGKKVEKARRLFVNRKGVFVIKHFKAEYMSISNCEVV